MFKLRTFLRINRTLNPMRERFDADVTDQGTESSDTSRQVDKEVAEQERETNELLRSNRELEQFAYVAAHDLKQPVRTVKMFLDLLDQRSTNELSSEGREFLDHALSITQRMDAMIDDLLSLAMIRHNERTMEKVCLQCVVDDVLANLHAEIRETGATITYDDMPDVTAHRSQLLRLMQNLIGNALKYRSDHPPKIHVSVDENEEERRFSVQDNGVGIAPAHEDKVFEVFRRLHADSDAPGTGVGLALCQRIVEDHGGRIWVDSQLGQGSTFHFTLPRNGEVQSESS